MGKINRTRQNRIIALILLAAGIIFVLQRKSAFSRDVSEAFDGLFARITHKSEYFSVRPKGEVRGGVIFFPQDHKDPLEYLPMLRSLVQQGLEVRVATYPLRFSALSASGRKGILEDGSQLEWISLGLGSGAVKACSLADKSDKIAGLILVGSCSGEVNLNDNDLQITFFELSSHPIAEKLMDTIRHKLPADTLYLKASAEEEVVGAVSLKRTDDLIRLPNRLSDEIDRMLAARQVSPKNRN